MTTFQWFLTILCFATTAVAQHPLNKLFEPGFLVEDRNNDGNADYVNVELFLGEDPNSEIIAAAADITVRLGFETMALNLPLTKQKGDVGIAIGATATSALGLDLSRLSNEEGLITTIQTSDRDWLVVAGRENIGTRFAAAALAGRLPYLWKLDGKTLEDVIADLSQSLSEKGVEPKLISVPQIVVQRNSISQLIIDLQVAKEQISKAKTILDELSPSYEYVEQLVVNINNNEIRFAGSVSQALEGPIPERPGSSPKRDLDLSNFFSPHGLLGDSDGNLIADRIDTVISPATNTKQLLNLSARLGLEAAGMSVPIVRLPEDIKNSRDEPTLILIGEHPLLENDLIPKITLAKGEGIIRVIPNAFGPKSVVAIQGYDTKGLNRAINQLSERLPNIWDRGKDRTTINDIELDLWNFFSGRSPAGQATIALYKLERILQQLSEKDLESIEALVSVESPDPQLANILQTNIRQELKDTKINVIVDNRNVQHAETIFDEHFPIESEVDTFWDLFRTRVVPNLQGKNNIKIFARLSEPPEVRSQITNTIQTQLGENVDVNILSAYKQGYSWLHEVVGPKLKVLGAAELVIQFARYAPPEEWSQQAMHTPLRWLHEAFPIDEILAKELDWNMEQVRFEAVSENAPPYTAIAKTNDGQELFRESFEPKLLLQPYINRFRDYEMVNVSTGWITVEANGETLVDQRIETDPERFWRHFQEQTIPSMYNYVMERHDGNPRGAGKDAPLFGKLLVDLELSEPDYRLGLDQEIISPMDALHEDIYFTTHMFFKLLGRNSRGNELTYAGRVIPVMQPKSDGQAGAARIHFTGFATSRPAVVIKYKERNGAEGETRLNIPKIGIERPKTLSARVVSGQQGISNLNIRLKVDTDRDQREELITRAHSDQVDENILSASQVHKMIGHLNVLRSKGAYTNTLAYHDLNEIIISAGTTHIIDWNNETSTTLIANGTPNPVPNIHRFTAETNGENQQLVQWDTPIPPEEAYSILAKMSNFEEATVYKMGESYLGQDIWAMDLMPPLESSHFSHYKATTMKPTVIYSARQHANEVSSTSHVLRFAELLLTDPKYKENLNKVNIVIHPITNADGAQLAYDLYKKTPDFILHAGYYASLGMDVTSDGNDPMPIYPESTIRRQLWNQWLPDIFLNPHGYPSHQLVQLFSEYTGLVRRGRVTERNWSMNKGWFIPGFNYVDDPLFPRHKEAAFQIRDYITKFINEAENVYDLNRRNYSRYHRYGESFDEDEVFKLPLVNEVLIHTAIKGSRSSPTGSRPQGYNPKVTIWSGSTEAPDETASGDWMKLVATAGLQWDKAILQYLVDGDHKVERKGSEFWGGVTIRLERARPPKPSVE